jgi:ABC-type multidrug transport system fused ATPase/permease subunit
LEYSASKKSSSICAPFKADDSLMIEGILGDIIYDRKLESETVLEYIARYAKMNRFNKHSANKRANGFGFQKIPLDILIATLFVTAVLLFIVAIFTSNSTPSLSFFLAIFSLLLFFIALLKSIDYFYNELRTIGKNNKNNSFIQRVKNFNLNYYERLIEGLSNEYSTAELKTAEMTLLLLMKEKKSVDRMFAKFTKIIAIFLVIIVYAILYRSELRHNPIEYFKQAIDTTIDVFSTRTRELIGIVILIAIILNIVLESISRTINFYETYLLILKKAIEQSRDKEKKAMEELKKERKSQNQK